MSEPSFKKDLVYPGKGDPPLFQKNTKAIFHFRTFKPIEYPAKPLPEQVIDDTRTMGCGPFELLIGREFKLSIWDEMIRTMQINEVARFICPFLSIIDYPTVSRTLRDLALKKAGKDPPQREHHCSFSAMQGTGHSDLDKIVEEASPLCFEFELVSVEQPGQYKQDNWAMSTEEKKSAIISLREEGNKLYREKRFLLASEKYFEALSYLEEQLVKEKPKSNSWYKIAEQKVPFLLNYAQCKLVLEDYAEVIRHTTSVLEIDGDNIKALYRRGRAYSESWDVEEAEKDLRRAAQLDSSLAKTVDKAIKDLKKQVKEKEDAERERLKGKMFG